MFGLETFENLFLSVYFDEIDQSLIALMSPCNVDKGMSFKQITTLNMPRE